MTYHSLLLNENYLRENNNGVKGLKNLVEVSKIYTYICMQNTYK